MVPVTLPFRVGATVAYVYPYLPPKEKRFPPVCPSGGEYGYT